MASFILSNKLLPDMGMELLILVDDTGTKNQLYIDVSQSAQRAQIISDALAAMDARVAEMTAYATAYNLPAPAPDPAPATDPTPAPATQ
jgi:hypothetical protein